MLASGGIWNALSELPRSAGAVHVLLRSACIELKGLKQRAASEDKPDWRLSFYEIAGLRTRFDEAPPLVGLPRMICSKPRLQDSFNKLRSVRQLAESAMGVPGYFAAIMVVWAVGMTFVALFEIVNSACTALICCSGCQVIILPTFMFGGPGFCESGVSHMKKLLESSHTAWLMLAARVAMEGSIVESKLRRGGASSAATAGRMQDLIRVSKLL